MESNNRDFKGIWIPKEIYLNKELSWTEKILLLEIDSLDCEEKHCYASNEYFSKFLGVSKQVITAGISKLKKMGLVEEVSFDGRTRTLQSNLKSAYNKSCSETTRKVVGRPQEKLYYNNIYNNTYNNIDEYINNDIIINNNISKSTTKGNLDKGDIENIDLVDNDIEKDVVNKENEDKIDYILDYKVNYLDKNIELIKALTTHFLKKNNLNSTGDNWMRAISTNRDKLIEFLKYRNLKTEEDVMTIIDTFRYFLNNDNEKNKDFKYKIFNISNLTFKFDSLRDSYLEKKKSIIDNDKDDFSWGDNEDYDVGDYKERKFKIIFNK